MRNEVTCLHLALGRRSRSRSDECRGAKFLQLERADKTPAIAGHSLKQSVSQAIELQVLLNESNSKGC
jgi:hypothetical protein